MGRDKAGVIMGDVDWHNRVPSPEDLDMKRPILFYPNDGGPPMRGSLGSVVANEDGSYTASVHGVHYLTPTKVSLDSDESPDAAPGPDGVVCEYGCDAWSLDSKCPQHGSDPTLDDYAKVERVIDFMESIGLQLVPWQAEMVRRMFMPLPPGRVRWQTNTFSRRAEVVDGYPVM